MKVLTYDTAEKANSVGVFGGGATTGKNTKKIQEYISKNNSLVVSINYNHAGMDSDYTYFGNWRQFLELRKTIQSKNMIFTYFLKKKTSYRLTGTKFKRFWSKYSKNHNIYSIGKGEGRDSYKMKSWKIKSNGSFLFLPSPSGFAGIVVSVLFRPKRILITGMDGPNNPVPGKRPS